MKKLVAALCVAAVVAVAVYVSLQSSGPPPQQAGPQLAARIAQCDADGSSFVTAYDKVAARLPPLIGSDRVAALGVTRGQVANLVAGRLSICEQALAIAQHDRQGLTVVKLGSFTRRLAIANAAVRHLEDVLEGSGSGSGSGSGDARSALDDLGAAVHAASRP